MRLPYSIWPQIGLSHYLRRSSTVFIAADYNLHKPGSSHRPFQHQLKRCKNHAKISFSAKLKRRAASLESILIPQAFQIN
jgi:hypothetical protein